MNAPAHNPFAALLDNNASSGSTVAPLSFPLTAEQRDIVDGFNRGEDMVISAGAGTGKTSTLVLLAEALYKADPTATGVYLSFNADIAREVGGKFFYGNVQAMTMHSLANKGMRANTELAPLMDKLGKGFGIKKWEMPGEFGVPKSVKFTEHAGTPDPRTNPILLEMTGQTICGEAIETIARWCKSDRDDIHPKLVPLRGHQFDDRIRRQYREYVAKVAQRMWDQDICSVDGKLTFTHDYYLKMWMLTSPSIVDQLRLNGRRTVLFFDEAQDVRPCMARLVREHRGIMQIVVCGDSSQAIYRFTGAKDSIKGFKYADKLTNYTLSSTFRFGPAIASVANQLLDLIPGSDVRIVPDLTIDSRVIPVTITAETAAPSFTDPVTNTSRYPDAIICYSNQGLIESTIELLQNGVNVYASIDVNRVNGIAEDYARIEQGLKPNSWAMRQFRNVDDIKRFLSKSFKTEEDADTNTDDEVEIVIDDTLVPFLRAITRVGAATVIEAMSRVKRNENDADVTVCTIHKSKGRQWDSVFINWTVGLIGKVSNHDALNDKLMLLYVAATRARKTLLIDSYLFDEMSFFPFQSMPMDLAPKYMGADMDAKRAAATAYARALDPVVNKAVVEDMLDHDIPPHKLVQATIFVQDTFAANLAAKDGDDAATQGRHTLSDRTENIGILSNFLAEVGVHNVLEVMDLSQDNDLPAELLGASLTTRGVTDDQRINKMLGRS